MTILLTTSTVLGMRYARAKLSFHSNYHGSRRIICFSGISEFIRIDVFKRRFSRDFFTFGWTAEGKSSRRGVTGQNVIHLMLMRFLASLEVFWLKRPISHRTQKGIKSPKIWTKKWQKKIFKKCENSFSVDELASLAQLKNETFMIIFNNCGPVFFNFTD